ncbi:hypothetical protein EHF_0241 [Ehrlichia japonica]|uniref:Uncharacterized protein n=1 Tax=Ehrlichia japonica TaxID=391036 RepID=X5H4M4_9RICK|nr:hypothetical protein EHF_0241 [Ehrlichia japonica]
MYFYSNEYVISSALTVVAKNINYYLTALIPNTQKSLLCLE